MGLFDSRFKVQSFLLGNASSDVFFVSERDEVSHNFLFSYIHTQNDKNIRCHIHMIQI